MTPRNALLAAVACVGIASPVHARCGFFGTQLECAVGRNDVSLGTQTADLPRRLTTAFRPQALHGNSRLFVKARKPHPKSSTTGNWKSCSFGSRAFTAKNKRKRPQASS